MLIDKPRCNFKNCRFYFDGNCHSADIYENCKLTDLHSEIAKLRIDLDNAKAEVVREIFEEIEKYKRSPMPECKPVYVINDSVFAELKKKYTEERT